MGGEIYHYHTKLAMKEAHTGGQFVWHQDYGYDHTITYTVSTEYTDDLNVSNM
jgi:hypothetical protein